jgi:hypothetical protein
MMTQPTRKQRQAFLSLNQPIQEDISTEILDILPACEDLIENQYQRELRQAFQAIINSPKWQNYHPKNRPECNLSQFVKLKLEGKTYKEIAEYFSISNGYAASYWVKNCQPILQKLLKDFYN